MAAQTHDAAQDLEAFIAEAARHHLGVNRPGGRPEGGEPHPGVVPHLWKWSAIERLLPKLGAHQEVGGAYADVRRTFGLRNPGMGGHTATHTLTAAIQYLLPGEAAPAHRHTPSALRFIISGHGTTTTVNGVRLPMNPGDLLLTPSWCWHDHRHHGDAPMAWLDVLDVPLVQACKAGFQELYETGEQEVIAELDDVLGRFGAPGLQPATEPINRLAPLPIYRWDTTYEALHRRAHLTPDPFDDIALEYTNPATGGPAFRTISCWATLIRSGAQTQAHRHSTSTIYHVAKGRGASIIGGTRFDWEQGDTFVVPNWAYHEHFNPDANEDAVLFSASDRPLFDAFGWYREQAYTEHGGHQPITSVFEPME
jgi:gentisate 1,2-dioxygenase